MTAPRPPRRPLSLTAHVLLRITLAGLACWLVVAGGLVWQLQRSLRADLEAQADRLQALAEQQLRRQLTAMEMGARTPDLARVAMVFGRPVCLRYRADDSAELSRWGCEDAGDDAGDGGATDTVDGQGRSRAGTSAGGQDAVALRPEPARAPALIDRWLARTGALPVQLERRVFLWSHPEGTLQVLPARALMIEGLWQRLRDLSGLTAATILVVNLLVFLALRRLLSATPEAVQALERLCDGDLATPARPRGPRELRRILAAIEHLRVALGRLTAQRRDLTARLIGSQEAERRDLAHDLHDELGQCLAALQAVSAGLRMSAQAQEPARAEDTETLDETIAQMLAGLRRLLNRLRPPLLESQGLGFALQELVNHWNQRQRLAARGAATAGGDVAAGEGTDTPTRTGMAPGTEAGAREGDGAGAGSEPAPTTASPLRAELHLAPELAAAPGTATATSTASPNGPWPEEALALGIYRAVQEALTNAARYAHPRAPVQVHLAPAPAGAGWRLTVRNVCAPTPAPSAGSGLGLRMMAERVRSLGGVLVAGQPAPGRFELQVDWPAGPTPMPAPAPSPSPSPRPSPEPLLP